MNDESGASAGLIRSSFGIDDLEGRIADLGAGGGNRIRDGRALLGEKAYPSLLSSHESKIARC